MHVRRLSRREFLTGFALAGTGVMVAACQPQVVEKVVKETVVVEGTPKVVEVEKLVTAAKVPAIWLSNWPQDQRYAVFHTQLDDLDAVDWDQARKGAEATYALIKGRVWA